MARAPTLHPNLLWGCRFAGSASLALAGVYVVNNFLTHGYGLAGPASVFGGGVSLDALFQLALVAAGLGGAFWFARRPSSMAEDAAVMDRIASGIIAIAFWSVLLVGLVDASISFLRASGLDERIFGYDVANMVRHSSWRGFWVHIPLMLVAVFLGLRDRSSSIVWLTLLVALAELLIVISRFVFSYEQPFMGDLVRFWYAALFLFASALTLKEEAHVRVDVIYAGLKNRTKALINATGSVLFGIPLCWVVIWRGLAGKSSAINGPMLNFEITQSGFGLYVKYLMAAFLLVFALSMLAQFTAVFFNSLSVLGGGVQTGRKES